MSFSVLSHCTHGAVMLITLADVFIREIQIRLFCDRDARMPEDAAEGVNVHAVHQAALRKVVSQAMRGDVFIYPTSPQIVFEIRLEVAHLNVCACRAARGEEVIRLHITILVLYPSPQHLFCFR